MDIFRNPSAIKHSPGTRMMVLYQRDNNLLKRDNLHEVPSAPGVYAIGGIINGEAANIRYVGEADNLQEAVAKHFDKNSDGPDACVKQFMLSIKVKMLVYTVMHNTSAAERMTERRVWEERYKPTCNEALNRIH